MAFLTDAEQAQMRADVAQMLPGTAVLYPPVYASDGAGGQTLTYPTPAVGGTVAARLDPLPFNMGGIQMVAGREGLVVQYILTMPHAAPIAADYRAIYTDTITSGTFDVAGLAKDHSWRVSRRAYVSHVE